MWAKSGGQLGEKRLFKMEGWGIKQDLIPYVGKLDLANVSIEGWIIQHGVHGLLAGPCDVVCLPTHCGEGVHIYVMTCGVDMEEEFLIVSLSLSLKGPCTFPYILIITVQLVTFVPVDYSAFESDVLVLGATMRFVMVFPPLKWTPLYHKCY